MTLLISPKTTVVNIHRGDEYDVYCGRPGHGESGYFGNPFSECSREKNIADFEKYFQNRLNTDSEYKDKILSLRGKRLGCFCVPKKCHCNIIADYLNNLPIVRLGFTGTQEGMTVHQKNTINGLLQSIRPTEFHHGDCIGADADFHDLAVSHAIPVLHPPNIPTKRAFKTAHIIRPEKAYLERNHDIVDEVDIMIGCPKTFQEELRSGTWATIRYAKKQNRHTIIVWPDGTTEEYNGHKEPGNRT